MSKILPYLPINESPAETGQEDSPWSCHPGEHAPEQDQLASCPGASSRCLPRLRHGTCKTAGLTVTEDILTQHAGQEGSEPVTDSAEYAAFGS
ncbi:uncharacterized protein J5F26_013965 isoform 2-T2 [Ciconia maguari]